MRNHYERRGGRALLALLVTVVLAAGLIPVGALAFAEGKAGAPEFTSVEDAPGAEGETPGVEEQGTQTPQQQAGATTQQQAGPSIAQQQVGQVSQQAAQQQSTAGQQQTVQAGQQQGDQPVVQQSGGEGEGLVAASEPEAAPLQQEGEGDASEAADGQLLAQESVSDGLGTPTITVTPPVAGTTSATAPVVTAESGAGYSVSNTEWCDADGRPLSSTVTFQAGQTYYLSTQLTPTASSGAKSYFRTSDVTCNGGTIVRMFNSPRTLDGRTVFGSLGPVISVTATETTELMRLQVGSNIHDVVVQFSYSFKGTTINDSLSRPDNMGLRIGSILKLTAEPKENYDFVGWFNANYDTSDEVLTPSGDALSSDLTLTLTIDPSMNQTAYCAVFAPSEHVHTWGAWATTTEPTCTEPGVETRTCSVCGEKETREVTALGHDWGEWVESGGKATRTCKRDASHTETVDVAYSAVSGDGASWTKGSSDPLTFTFRRNVNDGKTYQAFKGAKVDGADVPESAYATAEGSLILSLTSTFVDKLSEGDHTLTVAFEDGEATATFKVAPAETKAAAASTASKSSAPRTGDTATSALLAAAAALSAVVLLALRARARHTPSARATHSRR